MSYTFDRLLFFLRANLEKDFVFSYHDSNFWIGGSLMKIETHKKNQFHLYFSFFRLTPSYIEKDWFEHVVKQYEGEQPLSNQPFRLMTNEEKDKLTTRIASLTDEYFTGFKNIFRCGKRVKYFDGSKVHKGSGNFLVVNFSGCDTILSNQHSPLMKLTPDNLHLICPLVCGFFAEQNKCVSFMFAETEAVSIPVQPPSTQVTSLLSTITVLSKSEKGINILLKGHPCCGKESFVQDLAQQRGQFAFRIPDTWIHDENLASKLEFVSSHNLIIFLKFDSDTQFDTPFFHFLDTHKTTFFLITSETHDIMDEHLSNRIHLFMTLDSPSDASSKLNPAQKRLFSEISPEDTASILSQYQLTKRVVMYS